MGQFHEVDSMFRGVSYNKFTSDRLREAMTRKVTNITAKIEERQGRITKIRKENDISDAMLSDMILQYMQDQQRGQQRLSYSNSIQNTGTTNTPKEVTVPAGVIANLVTEKSLIETETAEVKRLGLILRNLKDTQPFVTDKGELQERPVIHSLTDAEIEYLGF